MYGLGVKLKFKRLSFKSIYGEYLEKELTRQSGFHCRIIR